MCGDVSKFLEENAELRDLAEKKRAKFIDGNEKRKIWAWTENKVFR